MTSNTNKNSPTDKAWWEIDRQVAVLFDELVVKKNLPTHDERGRKVRCRRFDEGNSPYDDVFYESVDMAMEHVKNSDPEAYQALIEEYGSEQELSRNFKFA